MFQNIYNPTTSIILFIACTYYKIRTYTTVPTVLLIIIIIILIIVVIFSDIIDMTIPITINRYNVTSYAIAIDRVFHMHIGYYSGVLM